MREEASGIEKSMVDFGAARTYLCHFLFWVVFFAGALILFNALVDPLGLFRVVTISGVNNDRRPALESGHRNVREIEILRRRPDVLILGTSRELYGIAPSAVEARFGGKAHNASMAAATIGDIEALLIGAGRLARVKTALIGLDYFSFDDRRTVNLAPTDDARAILGRSAKLVARSLATLPALNQSYQTIVASRCRPRGEEFPEDGHRIIELALSPCDGATQQIPTPETVAGVAGLFGFEFRIDNTASFERILRRCAEGNIDCRIFVGPMHGAYLTALHETDWERFQTWKGDLAVLSERYGVSVFDLSSAMQESAMPLAQRPDRFSDSLHYGVDIGAAIVATLSGNSTDRLTAARLAEIQARDEAVLVSYEANDPAFAVRLGAALRAPLSHRR